MAYRNNYYATAETLPTTGYYGIVHIFEDIKGLTQEVVLDCKFSTLQEAEKYATELNQQNKV